MPGNKIAFHDFLNTSSISRNTQYKVILKRQAEAPPHEAELCLRHNTELMDSALSSYNQSVMGMAYEALCKALISTSDGLRNASSFGCLYLSYTSKQTFFLFLLSVSK